MFPYIAIFITINILAMLFNNRRIVVYNKIFLSVCIVLLTLFSGLAASRGDYLSYRKIFHNPFEQQGLEIGFKYLCGIVKGFGGGYHLLLTIVACVSISLKLNAFNKLTPFLGLAVIAYIGIFFVPMDMGSIRFGVAMGFFLISIQYIEKRRFLHFTCLIVIGSTMHIFCIAAYLLYFINLLALKRWQYVTFLIVFIILYSIINLGSILNYMKGIVPSPFNIFIIKAVGYLSTKAALNFSIMKKLLLFTVATIFYRRLKHNFVYFNVIYTSYFFAILVFIMLSQSFTIANRSSSFFASVEPVMLSMFIKISTINFVKFYIVLFIIILSLANLYHTVITQTTTGNLYYPYKLFANF